MLKSFYAGEYQDYFRYLINLVGGEEWWGGCEEVLARLLNRRFYWLHPIDENLAFYGKSLRDDYISGYWENEQSVLRGECSVLEVLIILAIKIERELFYTPSDRPMAHVYFAQILSRLGIIGDTEGDICPISQLEARIDQFLEEGFGEEYNTKPNGMRRTLWEQINDIYMFDTWVECQEDFDDE